MTPEKKAEALRLAAALGRIQSFNTGTDRYTEIHEASALLRTLAAEPQGEPTRSQKLTAAGFVRRPTLWAIESRQALELIATPMRPDGTWNRDRAACRQIAAEALGRHDEEKL